MNNKKYMNIWGNAVFGISLLTGFTACSDSIDEHYSPSAGVATKTLWEQVVSQPDLTDLAKILEKVHYYTTENKASGLTYKDVLQANNKLTVWAPVNGSFNVDSLLAEIDRDEYSVDKRFIRNHINTFSRSVAGTELDSILMLNSKVNVLNNAENQFKGVDIVKRNIPATNGLLHKLAHAAQFQNNLYEYMQNTPQVDSLFKFFQARDTTYIDESQSVQGGIIDGEITYADTVWTTESKAFNYSYNYQGDTWDGIAANLKNEDSTFVMIMPTNQGWRTALDKTLPFYQYMSLPYANLDDENKPQTVKPDALQKKQAQMSIVNRLVFSPNRQKYYTLEDFGNTDSLFTTRGEVIDSPYCNNIFKGIQPIPVSNGYVYLADDYRYPLTQDIEVEGENSFYWNKKMISASTTWAAASITKANRNPKISGSVSGNAYGYSAGATGTRQAANFVFKLPNVLSATYDIWAIIVPENIADTLKQNVLPLKFKATLNYYNGKSTTLSKEGPTKDFIADTAKVDTILLFENFKFPVAYKGVSGAYPLLTLEVSSRWSEWQGYGNKYANRIYVDKIILKGKDE